MILFASLGEKLQQYYLDIDNATLRLSATTRLPVSIQFAAADQTRKILYIVSSNAGSGTLGSKGDTHLLSAFKMDPATGILIVHGEAVRLPERPIHLSLDQTARYVLIAYNQSGTLSVHHINANGSIGKLLTQPKPIDAGIFTHQVTVTPGNKTAIALSRGNNSIQNRPEDLGSINIFAFNQGVLTPLIQIEMESGIGPRHLAYHPTKA